jgi:peptidoglycan biosynthesis protein MviN/MurJ (putative lipid II flippase)
VEFTLLRRTLNRRIGKTGVPAPYIAKLWIAAFAAGGAAWAIHHYFRHHSAKLAAIVVLTPFGIVYFAATLALGLSEVRVLFDRFMSAANRAR